VSLVKLVNEKEIEKEEEEEFLHDYLSVMQQTGI
jgi:hypothetical protein